MEAVLTNEFYKAGFFGYGEEGDFVYGSLAHILPIVFGFIVIFLIYRFRNKIRESKHENLIRCILGLMCLFTEYAYFWRLLYVGSGDQEITNLLTKLPLQVCSWSAMIAGIMMLNKNEICFQHCVYVCLTLGLIPLFTPAVIKDCGPSYFRYYQFWSEHLSPIFSVFYMYFVHDFRPVKKGIIVPSIFLSILACFAIPANSAIPHANYMYLMEDISLAQFFPKGQLVRLLMVAPLFLLLSFLIEKIFNLKKSR